MMNSGKDTAASSSSNSNSGVTQLNASTWDRLCSAGKKFYQQHLGTQDSQPVNNNSASQKSYGTAGPSNTMPAVKK